MNSYQKFRLNNLFFYYMANRYWGGYYPFDSNTVGITQASPDDLLEFPNSVPDWPKDKEAQRAAWLKTREILENNH